MLEKATPAGNLGTPNRGKRKKALEITGDQYQQLKQQFAAAPSVQEKNMIFRRLINLLGVMEFLSMNPGVPEQGAQRPAGRPVLMQFPFCQG